MANQDSGKLDMGKGECSGKKFLALSLVKLAGKDILWITDDAIWLGTPTPSSQPTDSK